MSAKPKFQFWPLLDREINRLIGRAGVVFTALFCTLVCAVGYYFIRPWSVFPEADLRQLGYLGMVAIPLAAWLLGGLFAIQMFIAFQALRWALKKDVRLSSGTWTWIAFSLLLVVGGGFACFLVNPFFWGFLACVAGCIVFFRTTLSIWAWRVLAGVKSFPPKDKRPIQ